MLSGSSYGGNDDWDIPVGYMGISKIFETKHSIFIEIDLLDKE